VVKEPHNTLNNRYVHSNMLESSTALLVDDDLLLDEETVRLAVRAVEDVEMSVVGFFPRYVHYQDKDGLYFYTFRPLLKPTPFQLTTGQAHVLHVSWMQRFTKLPTPILQYIDSHKPSCEDITLHFMIGLTPHSKLLCIEPCKKRCLGKPGGTSLEVRNWVQKRSMCVNRLVNYFKRNPLHDSTLLYSCEEARSRFGL